MDAESSDMNGGQQNLVPVSVQSNDPGATAIPLPYIGPLTLSQHQGGAISSSVSSGPTAHQTEDCAPGAVGLVNLGNTCYMNSGLQCLLANASLVDHLLNRYPEKLPPGQASAQTSASRCLSKTFRELAVSTWCVHRGPKSPTEFKQAFGARFSVFNNLNQHDCQEFLTLLLDSLHEALNIATPTVQSRAAPASPTLSEASTESLSQSSCSKSGQSAMSPVQSTSTQDLEPDQSGACVTSTDQSNVVSSSPVDQSSVVSSSSPYSASEDVEGLTLCDDSEGSNMEAPVSSGSEVPRRGPELLAEVEKRGLQATVDSWTTFYNKENKTLNTNLLLPEDDVSTTSSKFPVKRDNRTAVMETSELEVDMGLLEEAKEDYVKPGGSRSPDHLAGASCLSSSSDVSGEPRKTTGKHANSDSLVVAKGAGKLPSGTKTVNKFRDVVNNAKRIKVEEEKNVRQESRKHVNIDQNITRDPALDPPYLADPPPFFPQLPADGEEAFVELGAAEKDWDTFIGDNDSIVTNSFHGQTRSTITCCRCGNKSVTFETFNCLSVPLPRAQERQIVVTTISPGDLSPVQHCVTLHLQSRVKDIKAALLRLSCEEGAQEETEIVLAMVRGHRIVRLLDDEGSINYLASSRSEVWAVSMLPEPPALEEEGEDNTVAISAAQVLNNAWAQPDFPATQLPSQDLEAYLTSAGNSQSENIPVTTSDHFQTEEDPVMTSAGDPQGSDSPVLENPCMTSEDSRVADVENMVPSGSDSGLPGDHDVEMMDVSSPHFPLTPLPADENAPDGYSPVTSSSMSPAAQKPQLVVPTIAIQPASRDPSPVTGFDRLLSEGDTNGVSLDSPSAENPVTSSTALSWEPETQDIAVGPSDPLRWSPVAPQPSTSSTDLLPEVPPQVTPDTATGHFKCVICWDDWEAAFVKIHIACDGKICNHCLQMLVQSHADKGAGRVECPVCQSVVNSAQDFVQVSTFATGPIKPRKLGVHVMYRHDIESREGCQISALFGPPMLLHLPSKIGGGVLRETVDQVALPFGDYTLRLVNDSGLRCSRCDLAANCTGCQVGVSGGVALLSDDCLALCYGAVRPAQKDLCERRILHASMASHRPSDKIDLAECLDAFTQREELEEAAYCPRCKSKQPADKELALCRLPDTLFVLLKRFLHDSQHRSFKLDNGVTFPLENFDLSSFVVPHHRSRAPGWGQGLLYDLQAVVCHVGSLSSGHYTAYSRHPLTSSWHYYNDETVTDRVPGAQDSSSAYILFYNRRGLPGNIEIPPLPPKSSPEQSRPATPLATPLSFLPPLQRPGHGEDVVSSLNHDVMEPPRPSDDEVDSSGVLNTPPHEELPDPDPEHFNFYQ